MVALASELPPCGLIVDIGFNAGHIAVLVLCAHPTVHLAAFDLGNHAYSQPCFQVLARVFEGRVQLIEGDSKHTLPAFMNSQGERIADLIHIDGDHTPRSARADLLNASNLAKAGAAIVFDDVMFPPLSEVWAEARTNLFMPHTHASHALEHAALARVSGVTQYHGVACVR